MSDDFFDELNAEIGVALAKAGRVAKANSLRKTSNNMRASTSQRADAKAEWKSIQFELDEALWIDDKIFAMFSEQTCDGCGSTHRVFLQYMLRQRMIKRASTIRFIAVGKPVGNTIPRGVLSQPLRTHICSDCCGDFGFDLVSGDNLTLDYAHPLTVSRHYIQEDINEVTEENNDAEA